MLRRSLVAPAPLQVTSTSREASFWRTLHLWHPLPANDNPRPQG